MNKDPNYQLRRQVVAGAIAFGVAGLGYAAHDTLVIPFIEGSKNIGKEVYDQQNANKIKTAITRAQAVDCAVVPGKGQAKPNLKSEIFDGLDRVVPVYTIDSNGDKQTDPKSDLPHGFLDSDRIVAEGVSPEECLKISGLAIGKTFGAPHIPN